MNCQISSTMSEISVSPQTPCARHYNMLCRVKMEASLTALVFLAVLFGLGVLVGMMSPPLGQGQVFISLGTAARVQQIELRSP